MYTYKHTHLHCIIHMNFSVFLHIFNSIEIEGFIEQTRNQKGVFLIKSKKVLAKWIDFLSSHYYYIAIIRTSCPWKLFNISIFWTITNCTKYTSLRKSKFSICLPSLFQRNWEIISLSNWLVQKHFVCSSTQTNKETQLERKCVGEAFKAYRVRPSFQSFFANEMLQ